MTQIFTEAGELIPVTVIEATQTLFFVKTVETDGYNAIQVGFDDKREVLSNKPAKGHVAKANTAPKRFIREFKNVEGLEVGAEITVDTFEAGDIVDVTGTSKGKGFQVLSNATDNHVDLWLTVLVTTVVQVLWDLLHLTAYSKVKTLQDVWWRSCNNSKP